jgi:hypothetical protein
MPMWTPNEVAAVLTQIPYMVFYALLVNSDGSPNANFGQISYTRLCT